MSHQYSTPGTFKGGTIFLVGISVEKAGYHDLEQDARRALIAE